MFSKIKDNQQIIKYLDFFSQLGTSVVITAVKNISNKLLREIMVDTLLNRIIRGMINLISPNEMTLEMVMKIRKEISFFFSDLERRTEITQNLGDLLMQHYDKNNFVVYDEIMEIVRILFDNHNFLGRVTWYILPFYRENYIKFLANYLKVKA